MIISILKIFALICTAVVCGKISAKLKLPAILGWLVAGIVFGPYLAEVVTADITDSIWYKIAIKFFEAIAGVMIGREIILKQLFTGIAVTTLNRIDPSSAGVISGTIVAAAIIN